MKPLIGITLDFVHKGSFSPRPHYAIRESYFKAVAAAGGTPIAIPFVKESIDEYLSLIKGLIVPGGDFGLDASWYVNDEKPGFEATPRLDFDVEIMQKALAKNIPLLGICAGMQILGGMMGCKLTSNINKYIGTRLCHSGGVNAEEYAHDIHIEKGSMLNKITGLNDMPVNSRHQEGIVEISDKVNLAGKSDDGVIEAIEVKGKEFALGIQWHPEFFITDGEPNFKLFQALVKAAGK